MIGILLAYILVCAVTASVLFDRQAEETIPFVIMLVINVLYVCGLVAQDLRVGVAACAVVGLACLVVLARMFISDRGGTIGKLRTHCLTPGLVLFYLLFVFVYAVNVDRQFIGNDEFSHWGLVVKNMFIFNRFGNYQYSTDLFPGYPPASALWEYFCLKVARSFQEQTVYQAFGWLIVSLMIPSVKGGSPRHVPLTAACLLAGLLVPSMFYGEYFTLIMVDALLGIETAYLLLLSIGDERLDLFHWLSFTLGLSVLCLTKASGVFLAVIVVLTVLAKTGREQGGKKALATILACTFVGLALGKLSWSVYLEVSGTRVAWDTSPISYASIWSVISGGGKVYQYATLDAFGKAIILTPINEGVVHLPFVGWVILMPVAVWAVMKLDASDGEQTRGKLSRTISVCLVAGALLYAVGMLLLYLFTYSEYEAQRLASFARYMATYVTGVMLFCIMYASTRIVKQAEEDAQTSVRMAIALSAVMLFCPLAKVVSLPLDFQDTVNASISSRAQYAQARDMICSQLNYRTDSYAIIDMPDGGAGGQGVYETLAIQYETTPIGRGYGVFSLGEPFFEGDVWTTNITAGEWVAALRESGCYYLYIWKTGEQFERDYGGTFASPISQGALYHLEDVDNGEYKWVWIAGSDT